MTPELPSVVGDIAVFVGLCALNMVLALGVHELGHLVAGRIVGVPVRTLIVGAGTRRFGFWLGETRVSIAWVPFSGRTLSYAGCHVARWRRVVFLLGGVVLNTLCFVAFLAAMQAAPFGPAWAFCVTGAIWHAWFAFNNLWPRHTPARTDGVRMTDGQALLALAREDKAQAGRLAAGPLQRFAAYGDPPAKLGPAAIRILALIDEKLAEDVEGWGQQLQTLARERRRRHSPTERLLLLDGALTKMLRGDTEPAVLEDWLDELTRLGQGVGTVRGSRGAALVLLGRPAEAKPELLAAIDGPPFDRFMSQAFLARAEFALGDRAAAERALALCHEVAGTLPHLGAYGFLRFAEQAAAEIGLPPLRANPETT